MELIDKIPYLRFHLRTLIASFIVCILLERISGYLFSWLYQDLYDKQTKKAKKDWQCHFVAFVHSVIVIVPSFYLYFYDPIGKYNIFNYHPLVGELHALSAGYFLWDSITSIHLGSVSFTLHGVACLIMMLSSFQPFLMNFGPGFLLFELSTPFVNINWFMDRVPNWKTTGYYYANGILLVLTFFLARIVLGNLMLKSMVESMVYNRFKLSTFSIAIYVSNSSHSCRTSNKKYSWRVQ